MISKPLLFKTAQVILLLLMFAVIAYKSYDLGVWNGRVKQCEIEPNTHIYYNSELKEWFCQSEQERTEYLKYNNYYTNVISK